MSFCSPLPPSRSCSFVIRGDKDEQAVLCSQDKTYDLKIADTSNMLLVIPGCKTPEQLKGEEAQSNIVHSEVLLCPMRVFEKAVCVLSLPLVKNFWCKIHAIIGSLKNSLLKFEIFLYYFSSF